MYGSRRRSIAHWFLLNSVRICGFHTTSKRRREIFWRAGVAHRTKFFSTGETLEWYVRSLCACPLYSAVLSRLGSVSYNRPGVHWSRDPPANVAHMNGVFQEWTTYCHLDKERAAFGGVEYLNCGRFSSSQNLLETDVPGTASDATRRNDVSGKAVIHWKLRISVLFQPPCPSIYPQRKAPHTANFIIAGPELWRTVMGQSRPHPTTKSSTAEGIPGAYGLVCIAITRSNQE